MRFTLTSSDRRLRSCSIPLSLKMVLLRRFNDLSAIRFSIPLTDWIFRPEQSSSSSSLTGETLASSKQPRRLLSDKARTASVRVISDFELSSGKLSLRSSTPSLSSSSSALLPMPSKSVSVLSLGSFGAQSRESVTPSPSASS